MASGQHESLSTVRLAGTDAAAVIDVLSEAFFDYPVMRFVLGASSDYAQRLQVMVGLFVAARALRDDAMFGVWDGARLVATVTTSNPADPPHADFSALSAEAWRRLGQDAQGRYELCVSAWSSIAVDKPQLHVNMIGVRDAYRGLGLARQLLNQAHLLCEQSEFAQGVSLTTENPRNVELYRHLGYEITGEARIANVLPTWNMFRPASASQPSGTVRK